MKAREVHLLGSLRSAHQFITGHAAKLGGLPSCGSYRRLREALERANAYANAQCTAQVLSRSATLVLHERRKELLRDHLAPLVAMAAAERVATPGIEPFRMPPRRMRVEQLRGYAVGIAEAARSFTPQFVEFGLPVDFADRMVAAAQAFLDAANQRRHERMLGIEATHGLADQLRRGRRSAQVLGAMVRKVTHGNPTLFEAWCSAIKPQAAAVRSGPEVVEVAAIEEVRTSEATPASEPVPPPALVMVDGPTHVETQPRLLHLLRGPMRRRWAA